MAGDDESKSFEYTPTWIVATVCSVIVLISLCVERLLHHLGKFLKRRKQEALVEALLKLKEELMLLGFISLLLTVFQGAISDMCIEDKLSNLMLPCKQHDAGSTVGQQTHYIRHLLAQAASIKCPQGKTHLLSLEALHHLHIFIFVLALVHVIFCATTMVLGGVKIELWKHWEISIRNDATREANVPTAEKRSKRKKNNHPSRHHHKFISERTMGTWRNTTMGTWVISFFKQFYPSVTESDYIALRSGFIRLHSSSPEFDFHKYMMRTLESDFKKVVGISWYLWLFVVIFLLLNVDGWHTYFWLSFLPLVLLLVVGTKLEHIITQMAQEAKERLKRNEDEWVKLSDDHFWFRKPGMILYLIHFLLFQNSFEIAFFFWILCTFGFHSCVMEDIGYIVPRLVIGDGYFYRVIIQVLCSYSTLPLYALVTQMGSMFKKEIFDEQIQSVLRGWVEDVRRKREKPRMGLSWFRKKEGDVNEKGGSSTAIQMDKMEVRAFGSAEDVELKEITQQ